MANNRIYIVCKVCKEDIAIFKTFLEGWYFTRNDVQKFLHEHHEKHPHPDEFHEEYLDFRYE